MVTYYATSILKHRFIVVNCKYGYGFLVGLLFYAQAKQLCGNGIYFIHINYKSDRKFREVKICHHSVTTIPY
jgi:hypothetical protein